MRSGRIVLFLFLAILPSGAQSSKDFGDQPVSERQLLCWIVAGIPAFNIQYELQKRGADFLADHRWLEEMRSAGASEELLSILEKAPPRSGATAQTDDFSIRLLRVVKEKNSKKFTAARLHLEGLVKLDKSNPDLLFALGGFFNRQEDWGEAIPVLIEALRLAPDFAYAHEQLSFAYYRLEISQPSIREAKAALALRDSDPDAHKFLGLAYLSMRDFSNANRQFEEALKLQHDYAAAYGDLALSFSMQDKNFDALKFYHQAEALDPRDSSFPYGEGIAYTRLNNSTQAIEAYKKAKDLDPDDMRIRQNLGAVYCNSGRSAEAVAEFQELLAIDPDWNLARLCLYKSLKRLGRMDEATAVKAEYDKREAGGDN